MREFLGREVFESDQVKQLRKDKVPAGVFVDKRSHRWSVDRLSLAPLESLVVIGDRNAAGRGPGRTFYGWLGFSCEDASTNGRTVEASARLGNDYHADIKLPVWPDDPEERLDVCVEHSADLANVARLFVDLCRA